MATDNVPFLPGAEEVVSNLPRVPGLSPSNQTPTVQDLIERVEALERDNLQLRELLGEWMGIIDRDLAWGKHSYWNKSRPLRERLKPEPERTRDAVVTKLLAPNPARQPVLKGDLGCLTDNCPEWNTGRCTFRENTPCLVGRVLDRLHGNVWVETKG